MKNIINIKKIIIAASIFLAAFNALGQGQILTNGNGENSSNRLKSFDSTNITVAKNSNSACRSLDGIPIDGSTGTPAAAPYNKGNWYPTIASVSTAFGGRPIIQNGGLCLTDCPINTTWNGTICQPNVVTCTPSTSTTTAACGAGYNGGSKTATVTTTCPSGSYGAPSTSTGAYNTSACIICPGSTTSNFTPTCPANYTAVPNSGVNTTTYSCATGSAVPTTSVSNTGTCNLNPPTCTAGSTTSAPVACGAGYNGGTKTTTTTTTCPSGAYGAPSTSTSTNTSSCISCPANTTSNFTPTCPANFTAVPNSGVNSITFNCSTGVANITVTTTNPGTCTANAPTCTAGTTTSAPVACGAGYNGGTKTTTTTTTCPSGPYGAPSTSTSTNTSSCVSCPVSTTSNFTPSCPVNYTAVANSGVNTTSYNCATGTAVSTTSTTNPGTCNSNAVTCTAGSTTSAPVACGAGYNGGTKTTTTTTTCPSGPYGAPSTTNSTDTSSCISCPSSTTSNFTPSCPANYTPVAGSGVRNTSYNCATGTAVANTTVTYAGDCTENVQTCWPDSQTTSCGSGYSGGTRTRNSTCATPYSSPSWSSWDMSGCWACPGSSTSNFTPSCPANYTPVAWSGVRTTSYNCSSGSAVGSTSTTYAGDCVENVQTCWPGSESASCGSGYGGGSKTRSSTCATPYSSPSWSSWDMSGCLGCPSSSTSNFTPSCPANYTAVAGSGVQTTSYNCSSGSAVGSTSTTYPGDCVENAQTCWPSTDSAACDAGYTGTKTRSSSCATKWSSPVWGGWDTSSCTPAAPSTCTFSEFNLDANRVTYTLKSATVGVNGKFTWCDGGTNNLGRWHLCGAGGSYTSGTEVNTSCKTAY